MKVTLRLTDQEKENGKLELLARILATQQASTDVLIEIMCKKFGYDSDEYIQDFNRSVKENLEIILTCFYSNKGDVDFDSLLNGHR